MNEGTITLPDGRSVGYTDHGKVGETGVLWCHGGPGSRLEPQSLAPELNEAGLRVIGIDRPGYGLSTPRPGRDIASWVPDGLAVADHLGVDNFLAVGVSTGGAYALALAASSERVQAVVACCALTDMRWDEGRAMMTQPASGGIWNAPDREAAVEIAVNEFGEDGSKILGQTGTVELAPSDVALFADPEALARMAVAFPAMFAQGVEGYVDDRLADGPGWGSFDVEAVACPVVVLHGRSDTIVPVAHAHYTASIVPGAELRIVDDLGHFSIVPEVVGVVRGLI